uniref:Reverse transcriptase domain-containing protein n=1 Tax=Gouania willdenowi TaxID=441366 RepID=A0A8C5NFT0_GOUWI
MSLIKTITAEITPPLTYISNLSFKNGVFPEKMKIAKIRPIYKGGEKCNFTNYRPISILPQLSKILEKLFMNRLDKFIEDNNILHEGQYGFRKGRSTAMAIIDITENIREALEKKLFVFGIFLDLKKAFDTINHDILEEKLQNYGIKRNALKWIKSYMTNRRQYVDFEEHTSKCQTIQCGVPQGSILGPKLFILYINDIFKVTNCLKLTLFADDTTILCSGKDINTLIESTNEELLKIQTWLDVNKLALNVSKTKFINFGKRKKTGDIRLKLNKEIIEQVKEYRVLGVWMDDKLTWKKHIQIVKNKVAKSSYILWKLQQILHTKSLKTIYSSLIASHLNYCSEIWGNNYKTYLEPLFKQQKKAIRILHKVPHNTHTNDLFEKSKYLKLQEIIHYNTQIHAFRASSKKLPHQIQKRFTYNQNPYEFRHNNVFRPNRIISNVGKHSTVYRAMNLWNSLDKETQQSDNLKQFKDKTRRTFLHTYRSQVNSPLNSTATTWNSSTGH